MAFDKNSILDAGNDILDAVNDAVSSGDFSHLGDRITDSIATATVDIGDQVKASVQNAQKQAQARRDAAGYAASMSARSAVQHTLYSYQNKVRTPKQQSYFMQAPVTQSTGAGKMAGGIVATTFSGIGTAISIAATIGASVAAGALAIPGLIVTAVFGGLTAGAAFLIRSGVKTRDLIRRYYEYGRLIGPAEFIEIEKLAAKAKRSPALVLDDLDNMKKQGLLPKAKMDTQQTTLMLTDHAYSQYMAAEDSRLAREAEEARWSTGSDSVRPGSVAEDVIDRGQKYVKRVREVNDRIPDTDGMSDKLYRLEEIMNSIFDKVKKQPQSAADLRKFMDYYLPTTDKLLTAYVELDSQPGNLDNVARTKADISDALDKINDGFEKLLNEMFSDMAMDIASDISVMNTMMKQDGLTESDLA